MIVTTSSKNSKNLASLAIKAAEELDGVFVERQEIPLKALRTEFNDDILVVGIDKFVIHPRNGEEPFFFHPNAAMFRLKRVLAGGSDPFVEAAGLKPGMSIFDCTLGLGADAIIAAHAVGESGSVTGIEKNRMIAYLVERGLQTWKTNVPDLEIAMRRIKVIAGDYMLELKRIPSESVEVVYFDPMFQTPLTESAGINKMRPIAADTMLTEAAVEEAKRAARYRVIIKDHFRSAVFERHGFKRKIRKSAKFHYGVLEKGSID
ncbi:class I SAM-dependent methyltransferase [Bacillus marinisedimentorum]|uniref:class I SAM-dependent methyltransferase n=1 Tax=Bacillus marinisedimentorum TaxID=1821260 RepID=UPI0007E12C1F|nr:class I SAM-dependent methyltransferase [Bacillus marinisedimentorum]